MKKLIVGSLIATALYVSLFSNIKIAKLTPTNDGGVFISEDIGEKGPIFYPASYNTEITNEPSYSTQNSYTFSSMNFNQAHKSYRGDSVKVAVIDSGLNYTHEDFVDSNSNHIIQGHSRTIDSTSGSWLYYQFDSGYKSKIVDTLGHGTNVASVIASQINAIGCAGIAPNVELYVYKVTNTNNGYEWYAINSALKYCIDEGMDVINMSFQAYEHAVSYGTSSMAASSGCSTVMTNYINNCYNAGITLVAAAGNFNTSEPSYPASNNYVISVGSLAESSTTTKAGYSNTYGIDLVAPGTVYVADKGTNSSYKKTSGTSFSAPIVTAAIALYKQQNPDATPAQIEAALYASCDEISGNPSWAGNGRLNIDKFLGVDYHDSPTEIVINNPEIVDDELNLEIGDHLDLDWTVNGTGTFDDSVNFYTLSGESNVVSVSSNGRITATGVGSDYVVIESNTNPDVYASVYVTVTSSGGGSPTVSSVTVTPSSLSLDLNGTKTANLSATVNGENNPSQVVTWSSSNPSVATVSASGLVTGVATGSATITATSQEDASKSGTCSVTVIDSGALPTSEDINDYNIGTTALSSSGISNGAKVVLGTTSSNLAYSVENNWFYVGTVRDATYVFTIEGNSSGFKLKNGNNYIYCSSEKKVALSTSQFTTFVLNNTNYVGNSTVGYFCFNSTGLRPYKTTSNYSDFGFLYPLSIKSSLSSISVKTAPTKITYEAGEYFNPIGLIITKTFADASTQDLAYSNETSSQFTFSPNLQTALKITDTSITITVSEKTTTQSITVTAPKVLSSISVSGQKESFVEGDTFSFGGTVTAHYTDGTTGNVTSQATFGGYNMTTIGSQTVNVSFGGKSMAYSITVSQGTLSSISVSGQTTEFIKNHAFVFDGTCKATFENGYQKTVTPTNVSSPDMTTAGQKQVTVTFTYNGKTVNTSYNITVASNRTVVEVTETTQEIVFGTITYPDNTQTISNEALSIEKGSDYTTIENNSIRLGSGSNTGTITVKSTTSNIVKVVVSAKSYGSDSSVHLSIGGTDNTITSSYSNYTKEFTTATNSCVIATTASKKRAYVQSITVYEMKTIRTETDISNTEDCLGLETFIDTYMHMDYVENLGYCADDKHHYYSTAKDAFNALNTHQRSLFTSNSAYLTEWTRLSTWAEINGDSLNGSNILEQIRNIKPFIINQNSEEILLVTVFVAVNIIGVAYLVIKKRKHKNI